MQNPAQILQRLAKLHRQAHKTWKTHTKARWNGWVYKLSSDVCYTLI